MARSLNQQMDLFERVDPVEIPDLDTPPFSPELLAESKEKVQKAPLDFVEGSITAPVVAAGDIVDLGAAAPPLSDKQMMMPGAVQYSAIEQLFETLSNQGVSRDSAVKLINENTPVNLEGSPAEFIGEMAGVTATGVAKAVSGLAKIASKYGDDAGKYLSEIGGELGEMFNRSTPGGDDFDGTAPATVTDTPPVAAQTDQALDTKPTMPDTSVSPIMIGTSTGAGRQAADEYDAMKTANPDMDEAELFAQTGVYKGPDGQHRLEVDTTDAKLAVDVQNLFPGDTIPLGSLLDFEDLFNAYEKSFYDNVNLDFRTPESLRNVEVYIVDDPDFNGVYSYTSGNIEINADLLKNPEKFRSTLLHEVQHAVQHREGFVSGSSSEAFISSSAKALDPDESLGVINSMDDLVKLADKNKKNRVKLNNNNDVIFKNHIEGVLGSPSLTPNVKYEQVDELSTNTITDVIFAALQREDVSMEEIKSGLADNAFKSKNIRGFLQELKDINKKQNLTERQQSRLDDIDYAINFIDKLGGAGDADAVLRKTILPKVLNAAEGAYFRQVEAVADLSYYRKYGEVEARLIQERDARRAQLRDMGFDRGEIFSILREEFPPENYTVPLEVMTAANVDVSNLKQATLRRPGSKGAPGFVLPESDVLLEGAERKPEGLGVADDVASSITMAEGGVVPMDRQMDMFQDGGLEQDGRTNDPVSGNEVPPGSTQEEVRDDIPAQLSEGEFVFPADVVRFIGLEKLMQMRQEAKMGLKMMEEMGQMGNSDEASMPDDMPFDINDLDMEDEPEYNVGGFVPGQGFPSIPPGIAPPNQQVANQQFGIAGYTPSAQPTTGYYQAPFTQYGQQQFTQPQTPVAQAPVPIMKEYEIPQFNEFVGGEFGAYDELREYRNEAGNVVMVPFKDGSPISPIPEGYTFYDPEETETEEVVTTPTTPQTTQTSPDDDGDSTNDETFATTDVTGIGYSKSKLEKELRDVISEFGAGFGTLGETFNIYGGIARDLSKDPKAKDSSLTSGALGGVLDAFRGNADPNNPVTFSDPSRMGSRTGQYDDTTRLHEMSRSKQVQIAAVARTVVGNLRKVFVDDEGNAKKTSEVDKGLSGLLKSLGISTSVNTPKGTVFKSRTTLIREIANAQARKIIEDKKAAEEAEQARVNAIIQKQEDDRKSGTLQQAAQQAQQDDDYSGFATQYGISTQTAPGEDKSAAESIADAVAGGADLEAAAFEYGFNKGGLASKPKPKAKKKMKRGGLASKK